jgi:glycosyltransferase involved in cell wall biosynthesis
MRTYWTAHGLAARGHEVHVVTNATEAEAPFRMLMRPADWARCGGRYGKGSVTVHWTDLADRSQYHIPMANPFASKLAGVALRLHSQRPFAVIYSHYLEPYGVAAHLVAQSVGIPHVARMAGSDAGRLWHHPQLEPLYDQVLRAAAAVITGGTAGRRALARGVDPRRLAISGGFAVPERLFTPKGPVLDVAALRAEARLDPVLRPLAWGGFRRGRPYFGVYGKLGETKGSFALLQALHRLKQQGLDVGLVALAHGGTEVEARFRERVDQLGLADRVLQLPFIPHWRVPEFLRGCAAVCCLEQDFPISFHDPIIAREVLLCGACLIGSAEIIRKIPRYEQLPSGYGCVALEDVHDVGELSKALAAVITDPEPGLDMRARGGAFARSLQADIAFPETLDRILATVAARRPLPDSLRATDRAPSADHDDVRFPITALAAASRNAGRVGPSRARAILAALERRTGRGPKDAVLAAAIRTELAIARAEGRTSGRQAASADPLFRVRARRWAVADADLMRLVPIRSRDSRLLEFVHDVSRFRGVARLAALPSRLTFRPSYVVAFRRAPGRAREPLLVDGFTAAFLKRCDGTRSAEAILRDIDDHGARPRPNERVRWLETLLRHDLIELDELPPPAGSRTRKATPRKAT